MQGHRLVHPGTPMTGKGRGGEERASLKQGFTSLTRALLMFLLGPIHGSPSVGIILPGLLLAGIQTVFNIYISVTQYCQVSSHSELCNVSSPLAYALCDLGLAVQN